MSNFLEIATPLAERGFRVFPIVPKNKMPLPLAQGDHFDAATTDLAQLEQWNRECPQANVGLCPDENFCFLETDSETELKTLCADLSAEIWDTTRVSSGRPDRAYYVYRQTMRTRKAGNITPRSRITTNNLAEFKQHRVLVVGPGSIHPKTGKPYGVEWKTIPAMPDVLLNRLCELDGAPGTSEAHRMDAETQRQTTLLDAFLARYEVPTTGDWFNKGKQWFRPIVCPWLADHENANQGTSTCVVYTEGAGYGFDCKHRCASKDWKALRAELESRFPDRRFSFTSDTVAVIGKQPEAASEPERKRPDYPIAVWDGTAVGQFAKLCAEDNNIPRKIYAESFRCALGAVVGDRISCPVEGALPRSYTIIIAPKGKGKGTGIRRAVRFFSQTWKSAFTSLTPGLLFGERDSPWKPKGIGAWMAAASSVPGMAKLAKDLEKTLKNSPQMTWGATLPRVLSVHEEMKTFLSALFIEGGVGSGLEGVVCQLWDDVSFNGTATGTREATYGEMMFSLLAGVTEEDWFSILSRGDAVGGGLLSRLNIIGTEGNYENVSRLGQPDFTALQEAFLPRVRSLDDAPARILSTAAADSVISEWQDTLPEETERINVHAWRSALLLAWLRHEDAISAKTAEDAVLLAQYQVDSHEFYRTTAAENPVAKVQARIVRVLTMKGTLAKRNLQQLTNANRDGTELWNRALDGLLRDGAIGKRDNGEYYLTAD